METVPRAEKDSLAELRGEVQVFGGRTSPAAIANSICASTVLLTDFTPTVAISVLARSWLCSQGVRLFFIRTVHG